MDYSAIRAGLKTALSTVTGLTAYKYWPDVCQTLPAAMPMPGRVDYSQTFDDSETLTFEVHVLAGWAEGGFESGQAVLDEFVDDTGAQSVRAALEADPTLGGIVDSIRVSRARDYHFSHRMYPGGPPAWGAIWDVEVFA